MEGILWIFMVYRAIVGTIKGRKRDPHKKLRFMAAAQKEGCVAEAKLCCHVLAGTFSDYVSIREYAYVADQQIYYLTYKEDATFLDKNPKGKNTTGMASWFSKPNEINEMQMLQMGQKLKVFYSRKDPRKAMCKMEAFINSYALKKVRTKKNNPNRDLGSDWDRPIDLRST